MSKEPPIKRKSVSEKLRRELKQEAGWRCAVPTCRYACDPVLAHIIPVKDEGKNEFLNMIALCPNCHSRFDSKREPDFNRDAMINIKNNLMVLNGRYSGFEIRLMEWFCENPEETYRHYRHEFEVSYLVKDGLICDTGKKYANALNMPTKDYILTENGKDFIERLKQARSIDGIDKKKNKSKKQA